MVVRTTSVPTSPLSSLNTTDIYGDELQDFLDDDGTANDATEQTSTEPQDASDDANRSASPQQAMDTSSSDNTQPGQLSYSAQIAQQFSAYKQTPSQERQQRAAQRPIPRVDSSTPAASSSDSIFGKKPSEMHDAGCVLLVFLSPLPDVYSRPTGPLYYSLSVIPALYYLHRPYYPHVVPIHILTVGKCS
jgi:hypothetical protein